MANDRKTDRRLKAAQLAIVTSIGYLAGKAWGFVKLSVPKAREPVNRDTFKFVLLKDKLQDAETRDGHYLLRPFGPAIRRARCGSCICN